MKQIDFTDLLAVVLIVVLAALSINLWHYYYPLYFDCYHLPYHFAIARGFQRAGGITFLNFWEFPPEGIKQYYPPLIQIVVTFFLNQGYPVDLLAKWGTWLLYPLSLLTCWFCARLLFGAKVGFYSLVLLSIPFIWIEKILGSTANGAFLIIFPLVLLALVKKRYLTLLVLTLLCMSTHLFGLVSALIIFVYALHRRKEYRKLLFFSCFFLIFAVPFLALGIWRLLLVGDYAIKNLKISGINELGQFFSFDNFGYLGILSVLGIIFCYRRKGEYLIIPSFLFSFLPLFLIGRGSRFWYPNAILFFALSGGIAVAEAHSFLIRKFKKEGIMRKLFYPVLIAIVLTLLFPVTNKSSEKQKWPAIIVFEYPDLWQPYWLEFPHQDKLKIAEIVRQNCAEGEFVYMQASRNVTRAISALSGRSISAEEPVGARMYIVRGKTRTSTKPILEFKPPSKPELEQLLPKMMYLVQFGRYYIYKEMDEKNLRFVAMPKKPIISLKRMNLILTISLFLIIAENTIKWGRS